MAVTIVVLSADTDPLPSITFDSPRVVVGRGDGADVRLPDPSVSHRHASLRQRGSDYLIVDEGSTNGTYVGAVRLAPQSPRVLRDGELIRVGRIELEVRLEHAPVTQGPSATRELALGLVSAALAAQGEALAVKVEAVTSGSEASEPRELTLQVLGRRYVVGRAPGCDLTLDDPDCSRRHVGLTQRGDGLFAIDLGSKNGSRLGGKPLSAERETPWPPDVELQLGATTLRYDDPLSGALDELERAADEPLTGKPPAVDRSHEARRKTGEPSSTAEVDAPQDLGAPDGGGTPASERGVVRRRRALDPALTDFLVGLLALVVLGISLLGLYWLLGS